MQKSRGLGFDVVSLQVVARFGMQRRPVQCLQLEHEGRVYIYRNSDAHVHEVQSVREQRVSCMVDRVGRVLVSPPAG